MNAVSLNYSKKDVRKKIKSFPREARKQILKTFNDLEHIKKKTSLFNRLKLTPFEKTDYSTDEKIKNTFVQGGKFFIRTGDLNKTFRLMDKRIRRIENALSE
jgi:hypothetical protein